MYRYIAWEFPTDEEAKKTHSQLISKTRGQPCSITRVMDLVVVICDNREAYRAIKKQKIKNGWPTTLPDEVVEMFVERRKEMAPRGANQMLRVKVSANGDQLIWLS